MRVEQKNLVRYYDAPIPKPFNIIIINCSHLKSQAALSITKKSYIHEDLDLLVLDIRYCLCEFDSDDAILLIH